MLKNISLVLGGAVLAAAAMFGSLKLSDWVLLSPGDQAAIMQQFIMMQLMCAEEQTNRF